MKNIFLGGRYIYVANGAEGLLILEHLGGNWALYHKGNGGVDSPS
jgi:hypothetical protein